MHRADNRDPDTDSADEAVECAGDGGGHRCASIQSAIAAKDLPLSFIFMS